MSDLNKEIGRAIETQRETLATAIVDRQWELQPELTERYGDTGHAKCVQDVSYHLAYLAEAIAAGTPALFEDYIGWVKMLFAGLNIDAEDLAQNLKLTGEILKQRLPPEMGPVVDRYIEQGLGKLPRLPETVPSFIDETQPLGSLARQYIEALLQGDRRRASRLIMEAVEGGTAVKDLYLHVFQPSQHEIGRLWQLNQISVAHEHFCTAATQLIISQLYPHIFASEKIERRLVATCVGNELHELGMRMVADFFEMEGWDTYYLGANTPTESILQALTGRPVDVLAISATITFHIGTVAALIERIRASPEVAPLKIIVGGYPFNVAPDLWQEVGADGWAPDAQQAVTVTTQLMIRDN